MTVLFSGFGGRWGGGASRPGGAGCSVRGAVGRSRRWGRRTEGSAGAAGPGSWSRTCADRSLGTPASPGTRTCSGGEGRGKMGYRGGGLQR